MGRKPKISMLNLLRRQNLELNKDLKLYKEKNIELFNSTVEKSDKIQFLEKKNKFSQERIAERDIRNDSLIELLEEYREVIAILGRESIRHRQYIENSRHSQAMQEVAAIPPNKWESTNFSDENKILAENKSVRVTRKTKQSETKRKYKRRK